MEKKMKRFYLIAIFLVAVASIASVAQTPPASPAMPGVVTVSFNAAVLQSAEAQKQLSALQTKYAPREAQLKALNDQIVDLQKQLQATADKLSDAEQANREQTIATKQKQLQRDSDDFKTDSQSDSQQVFQVVAQKMYAFLQNYSQQHSYAVVVERGSDAQPVVWYSAANIDITEDLIKAYNAQSGVTAPASTGLPSAPRPSSSRPAAASQQKPQ
jgi:outer membrane protein